MSRLTVIICTHNPRAELLSRSLRALAGQTLPMDEWELLVVDNASTPAVSGRFDLAFHPRARVIREEALGLTHARVCAIRETATELLVLVDDDNFLASDYLETALTLARSYPQLGTWGGQCIPEFEETPPEWTRTYGNWLAIRELDRDLWSNVPLDQQAISPGAGLCVRRAVAEAYVRLLQESPARRLLDRSGARLLAGGDTDLSLTSCDLGLGNGSFAALRLTHFIPPRRLEESYLAALIEAMTCSSMLLTYFRGGVVPPPPSRSQRLLSWYERVRIPARERRFAEAQRRGRAAAWEAIAKLQEAGPSQQLAGPMSMPAADLSSRARAADLTSLLERHASFSFLRLGDGELSLLLQFQKAIDPHSAPRLQPSCEIAHGSPGLSLEYGERLLRSYERCSFLDLYSELPFNRENLARLSWQRAPGTHGTVSSGGVGLIFEWVYHELRDYLLTHRCLVCGAEASLLRELLTDEAYRVTAERFWPREAAVVFLQPRRDGAHLADDLDAIKDDLRREVRAHGIDTIFLSLGGAAKILCHELAEELGIRAIDFGSALRSLTFSGSDGQSSWRSSHHPFLLRVSLEVYIAALRRARPELDPVTLLAKAHAQLCLDLQRKELLTSKTSDANDAAMFDASPENLAHFAEGLRFYRRELVPLAHGDARAEALAREFRAWRRKKGLGLEGRLFQLGVAAKGTLRRAGLIDRAR